VEIAMVEVVEGDGVGEQSMKKEPVLLLGMGQLLQDGDHSGKAAIAQMSRGGRKRSL
jgi:hypothetical protein